ncbi:uncharacterized protein LOC117582218 [Drosophila guanche]|uniref:uncharacterized protein LOC117582218 n=1 Tax=Drosophila guanche TaxID=7266 RepID=UPI001470AC95|nr:uncharacterized protein LOC117582218 [Drosophila guanche]
MYSKVVCKLEFTNVKCNMLDRKFGNFEQCYLKAQNRTYKYISIKALLYQKPVTQFKVNFALYKRSNGLQPISINTTIDGCKLLHKNGNTLALFLFGLFKTYSNINHSCPFDASIQSNRIIDGPSLICFLYTLQHDVRVEKLPTTFVMNHMTMFLPFPAGDYVFNTNWIANGAHRASVRVHATLD